MDEHILERDRQLEAVRECLDAAAQGRGGALFFRAEPGMGKTRLLSLAARIAGARFVVARAGGHELEQAYPYATAHQLISSLQLQCGPETDDLAAGQATLRAFVRRPPGGPAQGQLDPLLVRVDLFYALQWFLVSMAERKPVLLLVDDLHWSDPDSLEVIGFVARRLGPVPLVLIAGLRPWPASAAAMVDRLRADDRARVLELSPLSPFAVRQLLSAAMGREVDADRAHEALALTGGNPFLVEELARIWRAEGTGGRLAAGRALVLTRLAGLPAASLALLEAASVLGSTFDLDVALKLSECPAGREEAMEPLERLGLVLRGPDGRASFLHPLLWRELHEGLATTERRRLHGQAAALLRSRGAAPLVLAPHLALGAERGDLGAIAELRAAAAAALAMGARDTAALHLERALELDPPAPEAARIGYELGCARLGSGAPQAACVAFQRALRGAVDPELAYLLHRSWAFALLVHGDPGAARERLEHAMAAARAVGPRRSAELAVGMAALETHGRGMATARRLAQGALELAGAAGDPGLAARASAVEAYAAFALGDPAALERAEQAARAVPPGEPDDMEREWGWSPLLSWAVVAMRAGRHREAGEALSTLARRGREAGCFYVGVWAGIFQAELHWRRGRLHDAYRHCCEVLVHLPDLPWVGALAHNIHARILAELGNLEEADAAVARAAAAAELGDLGVMRAVSRFTRAVLAARRKQYGLAAELFGAEPALAAELWGEGPGRFSWMAEAPEALVRAGMTRDAHAQLTFMAAVADRMDLSGLRPAVWRCRALLAETLDPTEAEAIYRMALAPDEAQPLERGRTLLAYGSWLRRAGRVTESRRLLDEASLAFEAAGSPLWQREAEAERRSAGGRRRARSLTGHLGRLTPQEYRVAELIAQGHSNRQAAAALLVSPHTLETHMRHIFDKLEVTSRRELGAYFATHAPSPTGVADDRTASPEPAR